MFKKLIVGVSIVAATLSAYAYCSTVTTRYYDGTYKTCTTCCTGATCNTVCI